MHLISGAVTKACRHQSVRQASIAVLTAAVSAFGAAPSFAADVSAEVDDLSEIVVTGSRIARSGFSSPNPVAVIGAQQIESLGLTNVGDVLAEIPQNSTLFTPAGQPGSNFNTGATFANLRGLNPFFGTRTLTLVDTRRVVPTSTGGAVDLNIIPSSLIDRVETVTGGASAAYGSDAVAGVVNVILNKQLDGIRAQLDAGMTSEGDGDGVHASLAFGTGFGGDRGHVIFGAEYEKTDAINNCSAVRGWCADNHGAFTSPVWQSLGSSPVNGGPNYILSPNVRAGNGTITGVLYPSNATGAAPLGQLNADGTALIPVNLGTYGGYGRNYTIGGDGPGVAEGVTLLPEVKRYSLFSHASYDLTDSLSGFMELGYAHRESTTITAQAGPTGWLVAPDNAFLSPGLAGDLAVLAPFGAYLVRSGIDATGASNLPPAFNTTEDETWRVVAGLKGALRGSWGWDGYVQYGEHQKPTNLMNSQVGVRTFTTPFALPVRTNPALPYDPVTNPAVCSPGPFSVPCIAPNFLGTNPALVDPAQQAAAFAYLYAPLVDDVDNSQLAVAVSAHGDLFDGWGAGPVQAAAGAEYRIDKVTNSHGNLSDPAAAATYYGSFTNYGDPFKGETKVWEIFGEVSVPLLSDVAWADSLMLDLAARYTRNDTSGNLDRRYNTGLAPAQQVLEPVGSKEDFVTWKASLLWDTTDWLRLRATQSRDVRAPSFQQLYTQFVYGGGPGGFFFVTNPLQPAPPTLYQPTMVIGGNVNLEAEEADTTTVGMILSPSGMLEGLQMSIDWYQIKLGGAISQLSGGAGQGVVNSCQFNGSFCELINGGAFSQGSLDPITHVHSANLNLGEYTSRGFDVEVGYRWRSFNFRVMGTYAYDMIIDLGTGATPFNYAGQSSNAGGGFGSGFNPTPKFQANATMTYASGPFTGTMQLRHVGSGRYATTLDGVNLVTECALGATCAPGSINDNTVASATYLNLAGTYEFSDVVSMFARVDNVLGKDPPVVPGVDQVGVPTNAGLFDTLGRAFRVGVRLKY